MSMASSAKTNARIMIKPSTSASLLTRSIVALASAFQHSLFPIPLSTPLSAPIA